MKNFIKTTDENVAKELRLSGFTEIKKEGNFYVFLNNGKKLNFTEDYGNKLTYSNILSM